MKNKQNLNKPEVEREQYFSMVHDDQLKKIVKTFSTYKSIHMEALRFLKIGHKSYTKRNVFNLPGVYLTPEEIFMLQSGCEQLRNNMGLKKTQPFESLGIGGLFRLMKMFNYLPVDQEIYSTEAGFNIDKITFKRRIGGSIVILYNKVKCNSTAS